MPSSPGSQPIVLEWFLRGRWHASLVITGLFGVALLVPVLLLPLWINVVALVALVTLQAGRRESLEVLVITAAAVALVSWRPELALLFLVGAWLPGRLLGESLQQEGWRALIWVLLLMGGALLVFTLGILPGGSGPQFWENEMQTALHQFGLHPSAEQRQTLSSGARFVPGMLSVGLILMGTLAAVLCNRWQERLRGLRTDLRAFSQVEIPGSWIWPFLLLCVLALSVRQPEVRWIASNIALFLGGFYFLQGLSLVHLWIQRKGLPNWSLILFYGVLILMSQLGLAIAVLGILDRFFHWHGRWSPPPAG